MNDDRLTRWNYIVAKYTGAKAFISNTCLNGHDDEVNVRFKPSASAIAHFWASLTIFAIAYENACMLKYSHMTKIRLSAVFITCSTTSPAKRWEQCIEFVNTSPVYI